MHQYKAEKTDLTKIVHAIPYFISMGLTVATISYLSILLSYPSTILPIPRNLSIIVDMTFHPYVILSFSLVITIISYVRLKITRILITLTILYIYSLLYYQIDPLSISLYVTSVFGMILSYGWGRSLKITICKIEKGLFPLIVAVILEYLVPLFLIFFYSSWLTNLIRSASIIVPEQIPEPLSTITKIFLNTRIGVLLISVAIMLIVIWLIREAFGLAVTALTITKEIALEELRITLDREYKSLQKVKIPRIASIAISVLIIIPLVYAISHIISPYRLVPFLIPHPIEVLSYLLLFIIFWPVAAVIYKLFEKFITGEVPFKLLSSFSILLIIIILTSVSLTGYNPVYYLVNTLIGNPNPIDPLHPLAKEIETTIKDLNGITKTINDWIKFLIRIIWA